MLTASARERAGPAPHPCRFHGRPNFATFLRYGSGPVPSNLRGPEGFSEELSRSRTCLRPRQLPRGRHVAARGGRSDLVRAVGRAKTSPAWVRNLGRANALWLREATDGGRVRRGHLSSVARTTLAVASTSASAVGRSSIGAAAPSAPPPRRGAGTQAFATRFRADDSRALSRLVVSRPPSGRRRVCGAGHLQCRDTAASKRAQYATSLAPWRNHNALGLV